MLNEKELEEIRRKMMELEEEPPVQGWASIQAEIQPKRRWRLFGWLAVLLLVTGTVALLIKYRDHISLNKPAPEMAGNNRPVTESTHKNNKTQNTESADTPSLHILSTQQEKVASANRKPIRSVNKPTVTISKSKNKTKPSDTSGEGSTMGKDLPKTQKTVTRTQLSELPVDSQSDDLLIVANTAREKLYRKRGNSVRRPDAKVLNEPVRTAVTHSIKQGTPIQKDNDFRKGTGSDSVELSVPSIHSLAFRDITLQQTGAVRLPAITPRFQPDSIPQAESPIKPTIPSENRAGWSVGLFVAPRYTFRTFVPSTSDDIVIIRMNNANSSLKDRLEYVWGLNVRRDITKRFSVESHLMVSQLSEKLGYSYRTDHIEELIRTVTGTNQVTVTPVYETGQRQVVSDYTYSGLRIAATYYFKASGRHRLNLTMGSGVNLLLKGQTRQYVNGQLDQITTFPSKENVLKQVNYTILAGIGYNYMLNRNYELTIMPAFNYSLESTYTQQAPFGLRPYSVGVHLQLMRKLGK
ncbi:outer membrane beta-barrel protein [Cytophagaceae bacterium YF14B1]|uniref:Outer membrane beta-barrel protein n=1 Tax=Xanthocytophaga flava TaxID=3048013 RepID=A0AAE3UA76_9BACT|nr:outer membrane beta-barrel protein [Xanthocytophaga flavus]MDJ1482494.1 outer membrane beta-barrel protein [Xanthocytophaga flavus]